MGEVPQPQNLELEGGLRQYGTTAILASFRHLWGSDRGGGGDESSQDGSRCLGSRPHDY